VCYGVLISKVKLFTPYYLACLLMRKLWEFVMACSGGKESAFNARDPNSIPGWGRSPEERNGYPFQYPCLETSRDRGS